MTTADRTRGPTRSAATRSLRPALALLALVGLALAGVEIALFAFGGVEPLWVFVAFVAVAVGYLGAGVVGGSGGRATAPARCSGCARSRCSPPLPATRPCRPSSPLALAVAATACAGAERPLDPPGPAAAERIGPVDIGGGRAIHAECRGTGGRTVVLVSGYHDSADLWTLAETRPPVPTEAVLPGVARFARVCAFDRPGTLRYSENPGAVSDRSTPVPMPRTAQDVVADLRAMLDAGEVPGPYILVAHSLGGLFARLYAQIHPDEVVGLVLVDTFAPETPAIFGDKWPAYRDLLSATGTGTDPTAERIDLDASIAQLQQAPPLRPMPVAVLSKTEPFGGLPAQHIRRVHRRGPGEPLAARAGRGGRDPAADPTDPGDRQRPLHPGQPARPDRRRGAGGGRSGDRELITRGLAYRRW